ncbi:AMP-binding protein [Ochrobactrum sp. CGA5]|uniref:AMP-binding protein n=1 Tax=Ochrobactrum sp. CGA5 TaxID=2583453 RepID=UPI00111FBCAE|nr:AMP-binding protein [Ochrobactrum sp. CGA5]
MTKKFEGFLGSFLTKAVQKPEQIFALFNGAPITFASIDRKSAALAAHLRARGLKQGDRAAVMMRNSELSLPVLFGLARAGIVWVPVNAQQRGEGLRYILEHCEPGIIICDPDAQETIRECGAEIPAGNFLLTSGNSSVADIAQETPSFEEEPPTATDLFAIMYTSGTTGRPKGVLVTHGMMRLAGEAVRTLTMARADDVFFVWEPLYHIGGAQLIVLPILEDVSLAMVDRFSASRFWSQVRQYGATHIHYLGGILQILLKQPESAADREHPVRIAWGGGCPKEVWPLFRDRFGVEIRECYGMTEASSITTCNDNGTVGAVGKPMPWFTVEILDEKGIPVEKGEKGEIVVSSSLPGALFQGYLRNPEATEKALRNGALHTGDSGSFDADGNLWFHGRLTDSVRCRGENVSAWEVEHIAGAYPTVEDCAMIGVAADVGEQDIKLFVKPKNGSQVDPAALSVWLTGRLANYQNPRYIAVIEEFERTPSQRIMKHKLSKALDDCWDRLG